MGIKEKLLPFIPFPILKVYHKIKRLIAGVEIKEKLLPFIPFSILKKYRKAKRLIAGKRQNFLRTGNNFVLKKIIELDISIIREKKIDLIKIIQYINWVNPFNSSEFGKYQYQETIYRLGKKPEITIEFSNYGIWTVEIYYYQNGKKVAKEVCSINIESPEYNIAFLSATLPAEILLIDLWNITCKEKPTIVALERLLFNYSNLAENVFPFPLATEKELNTAYKGFNSFPQRMVSYIGMLYKMNPESKFKLYLCDHQAYYALAFLYSNGIPEKNFSVYLLSDGTGSYDAFTYIFGNLDADKIYGAMKGTWLLAKQKAREDGVQKWKKESFITCGNPCVAQTTESRNQMIELSNRLAYAYVITRESQNFKWILHNPKLLNTGNKIHFSLPDSIQGIDFVSGIRSLEQHREELIKMLGLNYSVFKKSYSSNKQICILLGSYPPSSVDIQYVDATINFFGKGYDYYFKEHPRTQAVLGRKKAIKDRGIMLLDSKIPTEIYMMIDANICMAGYLSSSFLSIGLLNKPQEQVLSIWGMKSRHVKTSCLDFIAKTAMQIEKKAVIVYD